MTLRRALAVVPLVAALAAPGIAAARQAPSADASPRVAPQHHTSTGGVTVDPLTGHGVVEWGHATNSPSVTVGIPTPGDSASHVRLSNDGSTWVVRPFATSLAWNLNDPAAGGNPDDGFKTVHVEYGDGTAWRVGGSDYLYLDRVAPVWESFALENGAASVASWKPQPTGTATDFSGITGTRMSLDGVRWSEWGETLDLRDLDYGGSWNLGSRTVYYQVRDAAENLSDVYSDTIEITQPPPVGDEPPLPVRFEFPRPAVTGSLFTIKPVYPAGWTLPTNAKCDWMLTWGDGSDVPNENFGEIVVDRAASGGGCSAWTFTLPYVNVPKFEFTFRLRTVQPGQDDWGEGTALYESFNHWRVTRFTAAIGTTDRHIRQSTIPLVYVLPESTLTQKGDPVTYRLHASGGLAIPQTGMFWTYPIECYLNPHWSQNGGSTFTYTPNCNGNWVTGWTGTYKGGYMRSQYDPVVDGLPPTHNTPTVRLTRAAVGSTAPVTVSWSGRDKHGSIYQWQLQRSVNGGAWASVALPSRLTTTLRTSVPVAGTIRYRVRARDTVGNWSAWKYGPTLRAGAFQESYRYVRWSGTWSNQASTAWMGGAARWTTAAGASASLSFDGRSVAWVARTGPTRGLVRVWIDGVAVTTVDLRSASVGTRSVQFATSWSALGRHLIRIENLGTSGSPGADVDAFLIVK